jgi:hypothetical protein
MVQQRFPSLRPSQLGFCLLFPQRSWGVFCLLWGVSSPPSGMLREGGLPPSGLHQYPLLSNLVFVKNQVA